MKKIRYLCCSFVFLLVLLCSFSFAACAHTVSKRITVREATCTATGLAQIRCASCNALIKPVTIDKKAHSYNSATCVKPKTCKVCGATSGSALGHDWVTTSTTMKKVATSDVCTSTTKSYKCSRCAATKSVSTPDNTHNFSKATCIKAKTCNDCGYIEGLELGHDWNITDTTTTKVASSNVCTSTTKKYKCSRCSSTKSTSTADNTHNFAVATCTKARTCNDCGYIDGLPLGHSFGAWTNTKEPTCTVNGAKKRICSRCKAEQVDVIAPFGHKESSKWSSESSYHYKICTVCKQKITSTMSSHTSAWKYDLTQHYMECNVCAYKSSVGNHNLGSDGKCKNGCGYVKKIETTCKHDGLKKTTITKRETCTETGLEVTECLDCGKKLSEKVRPKKEHTPSSEWHSTNIFHHWKICTVCGEKIDSTETWHSDGWSYNEDEHWNFCSDCKYKISNGSHTIGADGKCKNGCGYVKKIETTCKHDGLKKTTITKRETCTETGLEVTECLDCGKKLSEKVRPKKEHTPSSEWHSTNIFHHWKICTVCGEKIDSTETWHSDGWSYNEDEHWNFCSDCKYKISNGSHTIGADGKCESCGYDKEAAQSKCTHSKWGYSKVIVVAPTCSHSGTYKKVCNNCGDIIEKGVLKKEHKPVSDYSFDSSRHWKICSECKQLITTTMFSHSSSWIYNNNREHYMLCSCGYKSSSGTHSLDSNGKCICGYTEIKTPTSTRPVDTPKKEEETPPDTEVPTPPSAEVPTPPSAEVPTPPSAEEPTPPSTEEPTPPSAEVLTPPSTEVPTPPSAEEPTPPGTEEQTPPSTEEPTPPGTEEPTPLDTKKDFDVYYNSYKLEPETTYEQNVGDMLDIKVYTEVETRIFYCWDNSEMGYEFIGFAGTLEIPKEFKDETIHVLSVTVDADASQFKNYNIKIKKSDDSAVDVEFKDDLDVLEWEKECKYLDSIAIALRNDSESTKLNKNVYALDECVTYYIDYKNCLEDIADEVEIKLELPLKFEVVIIDNFEIKDNKSPSDYIKINTNKRTITWDFSSGISKGQKGTLMVVLKYTALSKSSKKAEMVYPLVTISEGKNIVDNSAVINYIYKSSDTIINDTHNPYMKGDANATTFRPDATITRAEGALVLARIMFGQEKIDKVEITNTFPDLNETYEEAQKAIVLATSYGLINGYKDGTYKPNQTMTRAEFMKILANFMELNAKDKGFEGLEIRDIEKSVKLYKDPVIRYIVNGTMVNEHWAIEEVTLLSRLNMLPLSYDNIDLRLDEKITRAEVTQLVNFFLIRAPAAIDDYLEIKFSDLTIKHELVGDVVEATREPHDFNILMNGTEYGI